jgi:hypothetical protein
MAESAGCGYTAALNNVSVPGAVRGPRASILRGVQDATGSSDSLLQTAICFLKTLLIRSLPLPVLTPNA